ncbi:MAG: hypothetical protein ACPGQR_02230 [Marinirhabdus sp.]
MIKITFLSAICFLVTVTGFSQEMSQNALGLRLGDSDGFGTELSYQRALTENNRLEIDLGWRSNNDYNAYRLTGLYQWLWGLTDTINWYAGAGGGLGQFNFEDNFPGYDSDTETYIYAAGNIGIEYNFEIPLLLSLDFRPEFGFGDFNDDVDFDIALGVRYQF